MNKLILIALPIGMLLSSCAEKQQPSIMQSKVDAFAEVELKSDISALSPKEKELLVYLFDAATVMDDIYWEQAYGNKKELLDTCSDAGEKQFLEINYGPWERLNANNAFIPRFGAKPLGANYYPSNMTEQEFNTFEDSTKTSLYTIIKRGDDGKLLSIPYHVAYKYKIQKAADLINKAAKLAEDVGFKKYLELRAEALLTDEYYSSDMAWMDMKTNNIDFVVGPIENYEDARYNYKAAHEAFILIKDQEWTKKLARYASLLPKLQQLLPVEAKYKTEIPGSSSDLGVYDAVYYQGDCNAGSKTIAINLPNDARVQLEKGSRKLQLKNSMRYKFEKILEPIGKILITPDQQKNIKFDAFFENVMFHEVSHGLGIKNTINNKGNVRGALKEKYSTIEEAKADILGVYQVLQLTKMGEITNKDLMDNYVTFMAGIFRSVRFGAASAHGKANMLTFNYFKEKGAFTRDENSATYSVNFDKMTEAISSLGGLILTLQGNGDYEGTAQLIEKMSVIDPTLAADLNRINQAGIPTDIRFKQGKKVLGL
ncbi:dipeptidyl-peptidase 3 family protein [Williamwhitmania taraxaci]|uniref:Peptidase family M49 n=1 Tax=Williamwhitmania taraxaci TaxID=1640674 RepID=A0A1G6H2Y1_9BACT|nr:Zn-dependent hydrolase [Williamwhitmania taraxaci]SDB88504.1 Peptidase family M49 [Williamwhitmania taraxaci]